MNIDIGLALFNFFCCAIGISAGNFGLSTLNAGLALCLLTKAVVDKK